jgi:hypothetical protein
MTDETNNAPENDQPAQLIRSARRQLKPLLTGVVDALVDDARQPAGTKLDNEGAMASGTFFAAGEFFQNLIDRLETLGNESQLLHLCLDISLVGFQGFNLSERAARAIDRLLAECESIAVVLTGNDERTD